MVVVAGYLWCACDPQAPVFPVDKVRELLDDVLEEVALEAWLEAAVKVARRDRMAAVEAVEAALGEDYCAMYGVYLTPPELARTLAEVMGVVGPGAEVVDLSCGAGDLLLRAAARAPGARMLGVEQQPSLAVLAAARLACLRQEQGVEKRDRVLVGDGLSRDHGEILAMEGRADVVIGNPPYVGEKGNRERFEALRRAHAHLDEHWSARMDLQYLFVHRGLDLLKVGGWLAYLMSAYWTMATSARRLRADLSTRATPRAVVEFVQAGAFERAQGHHSLLLFARRGHEESACWTRRLESAAELAPGEVSGRLGRRPAGSGWVEVPSEEFGGERWSVFADGATRAWGQRWRELGVPLGQILSDRQGFVSGADKVHAWNISKLDGERSLGEPIFLFGESGPRGFGRVHGTVLRPVLRGSHLEVNQVILEAPDEVCVLYVDDAVGPKGEGLLEEHLGAFRSLLEERREVRQGSMPWYRLHWPRARSEQSGPKLVVARRAAKPCFALDLSASAVSSDCTYLIAPDNAPEPLRFLVTAMVLLNREETRRYMRAFGKTKGRLIECYSEPLRSVPLPVRFAEGHLKVRREAFEACEFASVQAQIDAICGEL